MKNRMLRRKKPLLWYNRPENSDKKGGASMQAVIMAGGKGSRLAALTRDEIPKPMAPFLGKPLLAWQLGQLKRYGIRRATLVVGHLKEKIISYRLGDAFGQGSSEFFG